MQCKNNTFIDRLFTFKWIIKDDYHKYTLWKSTIHHNTNPSSGILTLSHSLGTTSMVSNVRHSLPKRIRRHGDGIWLLAGGIAWELVGGMNGYKMLLKVTMWSFYALIFGGKECFAYSCIYINCIWQYENCFHCVRLHYLYLKNY